MQVKSVRANVLPYLKDIGLIDEEGKTLDLARDWRDDKKYAEVCKAIRERIYPEDLFSAAPNPTQDREAAERWFASHTGAGASAVRRMRQFYTILADADVSKRPEPKPRGAKTQKKSTKAKPTAPVKKTLKKKPVVQPSNHPFS